MAASTKISLYSLSDLKTTLDDHTPIYLSASNTPSSQPLPRQLRFTPSYRATYIKLGLGYSAVAIALYTFYLDYVLKQDFADTRRFTTLAVIVYFVLNGALTLWIWLGERGLIFEGVRTGKHETSLEIRSLPPHRKFDPTYRISVAWRDGGGKRIEKEITVSFTRFFTGDGTFAPAEYEAWLRKEIPLFQDAEETAKLAAAPKQIAAANATQPVISASTAMEDDDMIVVDSTVPNYLSPGTPVSNGKKKTKRKV